MALRHLLFFMVVVCVVICFCCLNMEGGMDFFMFVLFLVRVVVFLGLVGCCLGFGSV